MDASLTQFVLLCVVGTFIARLLLAYRRRYSLVRMHQCQHIARHPDAGFWGTKTFSEKLENDIKAGNSNEASAKDFEKSGSSTYIWKEWNGSSIHTLEPLIHQVISTNTHDWIKEPRWVIKSWSGDNILNQNGLEWRRSRNLINPLFMRKELNDTRQFRIHVDRMIEQIPRDESTIDVQYLIRKLFVDSASESIFGHSFDSLLDTSGESDAFLDAYDRAVIGAGKRIRPTGFLTHLRLAMKRNDGWLDDCKSVHALVDTWIAAHGRKTEETIDSPKRYLLIDGMSKAFKDPIELRFQLLSIFSLARDIPAVLASNALFLLARSPLVWSQLRGQALEFGARDEITFDQLMNLSFFRNTVFETLRLHSPITNIRRMAARDTVLPIGGGPSGLEPAFVPQGTFVWVYKYPKWRNTELWGEDVDEFRPLRFENRTLGWEFSPFSSGPHSCPANRQVVAQVIYMLYRLTLEFESIENRDPCRQFVEAVMMCIHSKNGALISLKPSSSHG